MFPGLLASDSPRLVPPRGDLWILEGVEIDLFRGTVAACVPDRSSSCPWSLPSSSSLNMLIAGRPAPCRDGCHLLLTQRGFRVAAFHQVRSCPSPTKRSRADPSLFHLTPSSRQAVRTPTAMKDGPLTGTISSRRPRPSTTQCCCDK